MRRVPVTGEQHRIRRIRSWRQAVQSERAIDLWDQANKLGAHSAVQRARLRRGTASDEKNQAQPTDVAQHFVLLKERSRLRQDCLHVRKSKPEPMPPEVSTELWPC